MSKGRYISPKKARHLRAMAEMMRGNEVRIPAPIPSMLDEMHNMYRELNKNTSPVPPEQKAAFDAACRMPRLRFPQQEAGSIGGRDRTQFPFLQHLMFNGIPLICDPTLEWKDTDPLAECAAMMHALAPIPAVKVSQ